MGAGVVDDQQVSPMSILGSIRSMANLSLFSHRPPATSYLWSQGASLLAHDGDVVIGAVHGRAHQVGGAGVHADVLLISVLFVDGLGDQRSRREPA